jgi:hypothetical protein
MCSRQGLPRHSRTHGWLLAIGFRTVGPLMEDDRPGWRATVETLFSPFRVGVHSIIGQFG